MSLGGALPGPSSISDLQLWIDATQETGLTNGQQVSTATDFSGNGRSGTGTVWQTQKPLYQTASGPNSLPWFYYGTSGSVGGYFTFTDFISSYTSGHGFAVCKVDGTTVDPCPPFSQWGTATDGYYPFNGNVHIYDTFGTNARKDNITPASSLTAWHLYEARTASGAWSLYQNGTQISTTGTNTVAFTSSPQIGYLAAQGRIFRGGQATNFFYNRVLNSGEIQTIYDYIESRYAITLP